MVAEIFYPFEVTVAHIAYACLGGFVVLFGMFSLFLREKLYISEACWSFLFGVIVGPYCANVFNPRAWSGDDEEVTNVIVLEFTRVVLAIGVFAIGVELPKAYMAKHWKSLFFLLAPVMTWGWVVSAAFIYALIPNLSFVGSLAIAACLTPTDPILAAAVIGGKWADKHVPAHIRHLLAAESGCNDGAAFPFLFLALYLLLDFPNVGLAMKHWFLILWLYQIALGILVGALLGFGFRHLMKFCEKRDLIDRHSYVAQYVSLAMFTIGVTTLLGSDDLLAAFACGTAFAWDGFFNRQTEESVFSSVIDLLFNVAAFIFVGAWTPFNKFQDAALGLSVWRLIVIAILVLLFRRLPVMMALYRWIPDVKNFREALFSGHFGPIGIGAVFISTLAIEIIHKAHKTEENSQNYGEVHRVTELMQPIVAFMVLCSITVHGLSIPSFSLGRRVHSVSRTWSRHATATSGGLLQPEWTNQARLVSRGADIVINRDHSEADLERGLKTDSEKTRDGSGSSIEDLEKEKERSGESGQLSVPASAMQEVRFVEGEGLAEGKERLKQKAEPVEETVGSVGVSSAVNRDGAAERSSAGASLALPTIREPEGVYSPRRRSVASEMDTGYVDNSTDYREENPPDGGRLPRNGEGEEITEWRSGHQRIIERRAGPGEDVEVTIIDDPDRRHSGVADTMHDLERSVSKELTAAANGLVRVGSRVKEIVGTPQLTRAGSGGRASEVTLRMRRRRSSGGQHGEHARDLLRSQIHHPHSPTTTQQKTQATTAGQGQGADDEMWESDDSDNGRGDGDGGARTGRSGRQHSKKARVGHALKNLGFGKRRGSVSGSSQPEGRGRVSSRPGLAPSIPSFVVTPADDESSNGHGQGSSGRASGSRQGDRLGMLQRDRQRTRESSPARSVRFAEGTRTPRAGTDTPPFAS
ncbi:hypothetical protein FA15DRAFT_671226 [Coprinopsis marcescibilis]|uniref:Cation/H+ exchanger transmembrane domain-containing protein n=1 Tax=Coprinopsis marcescibilis TaxID=230819 RepID=A0A5C3KQ80_COPMA|nr:hypothetical protein FA15DRAFT_671226 [Coprinopsis marcescibilis]